MNVFETETMAELCVKQGLVEEALAMYERLVARAPDVATRARREARARELASRLGAPAPTPDGSVGDAPTLALERRGDALVFTWALPPATAAPALQLLLMRGGPDGVETEARTLPLAATRGTTTVDAPALLALRAAAGWLDGARFVPLGAACRLESP